MARSEAAPGANKPRLLRGRRRGRKLRAGRQNLLERRLPQLALAPPPDGVLDIRSLFDAAPADVWLEIGFGAGEHLAWQAERHPEVGFIGAEVFINGVASLLRQVDAAGLTNLRLWLDDGRDLIDALPPESLGRVFVLFPDPWRKARHHKRRFIQRATLDRLAEIMKDGAELRFATDHAGYLLWSLERLSAHPDFLWLARASRDWRERPDDWPPTRYERKAVDQGRRPTYLRFVRRRRGRPSRSGREAR